MTWYTRALGAVITALLSVGAAAASGNGPYYPPNVVDQIDNLSDRADALGFNMNGAPDPTHCYHLQGIARTSGPGTPYFFISQSGNDPGGLSYLVCLQWCTYAPCTLVGDGPGYIHVVKMGSRDADGERLRSNRIVAGESSTADSAPDALDGVVLTLTFDGTGSWPAFGHPGGMQIVGDVLAVGLEHPYSPQDIADNVNRVLFIDISNPENPQPLTSLPIPVQDGFSVGAVAITPLPDGRYLLLVTGQEGDTVKLFESNQTNLKDPNLTWQQKLVWKPNDDPAIDSCWPEGGWYDYAHQSLNFVREGGPTGQLYLIGGRNTDAAPLLGDDRIDAYTFNWDGETLQAGCATSRHVHAHPSADGALLFHNKVADFAAASGTYVSPSGEILFYGTEHDNDGPNRSIKTGEWRHRDMVRPGSPTLDPSVNPGGPYEVPEGGSGTLVATPALPATKAWVQLWADDGYDDRYVVIDYLDRFKDDFNDFEKLDDAAFNPLADGFGDQASSARWMAPPSCLMHLNRDHVSWDGPELAFDKRASIGGLGETQAKSDLHDMLDDAQDHDMNDSISSVIFRPGCDAYYDVAALQVTWDNNGDNVFETSGTSVAFSAASLDGPTTATATARVTHPADGRSSTSPAAVHVYNVAPVLGSLSIKDPAGREVSASAAPTLLGIPLTLTATFTDPGVADTQTGSVDWSDGTISQHADLDAFTGATGGVIGSLKEGHTYTTPGEHVVNPQVLDDDGGLLSPSTTVNVLSARDALQLLIDQLDVLIAGSTGSQRAAWQSVRDLLDGNLQGDPYNGAIDKLDSDDLEAAVVRIVQAIDALRTARSVTGVDTTDMQALLAMSAWSIAVEAQKDAIAANNPPTAGEAKQLAKIQTSITTGAARLTAKDWSGAAQKFLDAVKLAVSIS
ncbi:MAG TPA: hypothetical protein VGS03_13250 [Candidatus Polarisedimenticolia bacterium]|jgi:hypothetical protein|nr:hypothetical protein [Candidatus Polarisedimenticolia bacterium]